MRPTRRFGLSVLAMASISVAASSASRAGHWFHRHGGTPPPGAPRAIEHTHPRAGCPICLSPHAAPTNTPEYAGYYVGGGVAHGGHPGGHEEGTWGWDYVGLQLPRYVFLRWGHGRRYQGGTGYYATDGTPVPDVVGLTVIGTRQHVHGDSSNR